METSPQASDKQIAFLRKLGATDDQLEGLTGGRGGTASGLIDTFLRHEQESRIAEMEAKPRTEPGYYISGDDVYLVVWNRDKTRTYAKRLDIFDDYRGGGKHARWEYSPGSVFGLADLRKLTAVEAARLGHLHGVCVVCATQLTDPESVVHGIGPVCYKKLEGTRRPKLSEAEIAERLQQQEVAA